MNAYFSLSYKHSSLTTKIGKPKKWKFGRIGSRCQFHQHFTSSFFVRKSFKQLFCTYGLSLYLFGKRKLTKKLLVKCWSNWLQVGENQGQKDSEQKTIRQAIKWSENIWLNKFFSFEKSWGYSRPDFFVYGTNFSNNYHHGPHTLPNLLK